MTDTRDPKPYHPPKAYEPPAEGSASGSGSTSSKGSKDGKAAKPAKETKKQAAAEDAGKSAGPAAAEPAGKAPAAAAEAPAAAQGAPAAKGPAKGRPPAQRAAEEQQPRVPRPAAPAAAAARPAPRTRSARLRVAKADPWSVMKVSFLLSIALGVCTIVAAAVLWTVMDAMGVFSTVGGTINDATSSEGGGFDLQSFLSLPNVLLFTTVIAVIDVVLATALATLGAFVYNLSAGFVGGVELTLAEDE
ncbi:DUF3566 domain-containing protein [Streptomyces sp. NPDC020379]|uniref:DUF3566 domain-containing protein n=1 Tax=Streptomyces sp. NPDC020379 TaxID=3365071 RepID=UPI0037AB2F01